MDWKVTLMAIGTLVLAYGYGLFLTHILTTDEVSLSQLAAAIMGAGLLIGMAVGTTAVMDINRFLEPEE